MNDNAITIYNQLLEAADNIISEGLSFSRRDDPHRYGGLAAQFDDRTARPRLTIEFVSEDQVAVGLELVGQQDGSPIALQVFGTLLRKPADGVH